MGMQFPRVYDQSGRMLAVLDTALQVGYTLKNNDLHLASMRLPTPDARNQYCASHNHVEIFDGDERVGLFRILTTPSAGVSVTEYTMEHVAATLLDDVMVGYHEIGGADIPIADVIRYILGFQTTPRWQLGRCDFATQLPYKLENVNLLAALLSVANVLTEEYHWDFDDSITPWTVNLIRPPAEAESEIRYGRNAQGIERSVDATTLITRLYMLGYGEGVNQLTMAQVNDGRLYLDADTLSTWGIKAAVVADTTIEDPETLKARAQAILAEHKNPVVSYTAQAVDLYKITGLEWDRFRPGHRVRVVDEALGADLVARIVTKDKPDVYGDPGAVTLEIASRVRNASDSISALASRQSIHELYSQGATNLYSQQFADNADQEHPAVMRFYVPTGCVRINSVMLSWRREAFRGYAQAAASGGGSTATSEANADVMETSESNATEAVPVYIQVTSSNGYTTSQGATNTNGTVAKDGEEHNHSFPHTHEVYTYVEIPTEWVNIPGHTHNVKMSAHTHQVNIPYHSHGITYGIYEGGTCKSLTIRVDGTDVPAEAMNHAEVDVCPYLSTDEAGRVQRGTWHTVELVPDGITRIEANLFVQTFVQSVGGGDY